MAIYVVVLLWSMSIADYNVWGAILVVPVLLLVTFPLAQRVARSEEDPLMVRIVLLALILKLSAAIVRLFFVFEVYEGSADASRYMRYGQSMAESFRQGIFQVDSGPGSAGTTFTRYLAAVVFTVVGPTTIGASLVFSWMGFWGLYFFYRAFRIGIPDGDHRRYAFLALFLPSLLFWPSGVGKDAWMLLTIGLSSYGVARILMGQPGGYASAALGLLAAAMVRPHMAALVAAGLVAAYLFRQGTGSRALGPVSRVAGLAVVLAGLLLVVQATEQRLGVEGISGAEEAIDDASEQTSQGGSEFQATRPRSPFDIPRAAFSVMFRPLPHEAHNPQALLASLEGMALLGLFIFSLPRLRSAWRLIWLRPYLLFALAYSLLFILAFASLGNFGILVRQRVQLYPLVLIVLALPPVVAREKKERRHEPLEAEA